MTTPCQDMLIKEKWNEVLTIYTIYKYTNSINGKVYVGQTSLSLEERAQSNGNNYRQNRRFYNAIKKYSWNSFVPTILATAETYEEAIDLEAKYILMYDSTNPEHGYNLSPGVRRKGLAKETCEIISSNAKERYQDPTNNPMYGKSTPAKRLKK